MALDPLHIEKLKKLVGPKTYFEELAEMGYLSEYLETFLKDRFENDMEFRLEMYALLQKYAFYPIPFIDDYYLQYLNTSLDYFLKGTQKWTSLKQ